MIRFKNSVELEYWVSKMPKEDTYILPLKGERLGLPIAFDNNIKCYAQLDKNGAEGRIFSPVEIMPDEGWIIRGSSYVLGEIESPDGGKWYNISTVGIGSAQDSELSKKLDKFVDETSQDGEYSFKDENIVRAICIASELDIPITIGWLDPKAPICMWISEGDLRN